MESEEMARDFEHIIKEGSLWKQSRYFKRWRKRWFVLTRTTLYTFKERKVYSSPTEVIRLNTITHTSCAEEKARDHVFRISTTGEEFLITASNCFEKEQWMGQISKTMLKLNSRGLF